MLLSPVTRDVPADRAAGSVLPELFVGIFYFLDSGFLLGSDI
jgi:hypothetical protein